MATTDGSEPPLVLIVDDYEDGRAMYAEYLRSRGLRVEEAADGAEAIERARALRPAVILMDMSMPKVDGWEATRVIKADLDLRGVCIIALTGHGEAKYLASAREAGVDAIVVKPCTPDAVLELVLKHCAPSLDRR